MTTCQCKKFHFRVRNNLVEILVPVEALMGKFKGCDNEFEDAIASAGSDATIIPLSLECADKIDKSMTKYWDYAFMPFIIKCNRCQAYYPDKALSSHYEREGYGRKEEGFLCPNQHRLLIFTNNWGPGSSF